MWSLPFLYFQWHESWNLSCTQTKYFIGVSTGSEQNTQFWSSVPKLSSETSGVVIADWTVCVTVIDVDKSGTRAVRITWALIQKNRKYVRFDNFLACHTLKKCCSNIVNFTNTKPNISTVLTAYLNWGRSKRNRREDLFFSGETFPLYILNQDIITL